MAIQFNCPYCTATIQVPDFAAGKKGTCPQCRTKLVVPVPKQPQPASLAPAMPVQPAPPFAANAPAPQAVPATWMAPQHGAAPVMPGAAMPPGYIAAPMSGYPPAMYPGQVQMPGRHVAPFNPAAAAMISEPPAFAEEAIVPRRSRARRRSPNIALMLSLIGGTIAIAGALAFVFLKPTPKADPFQGDLIGMRRENTKLEPAVVHKEWINLDQELVATVMKQLEKSTIKLRSERIDLRMQGTADGIKVSIGPGPSGILVGVDVKQNEGLAAWTQREGNKLTDQHQKSVIQSATRFVKEWATAEARGEKMKDLGLFHDELGLAALTSGLGSEVIAVVGETIFPCVAEQKGQLFFLLPPGTDKFELQGRLRDNKKAVFPGQYRVTVLAAPATEAPAKKSPVDSESDADKEMERNAFGRPALNTR